MAQTMKAWFAVPGPEGAKFELREAPAPTAAAGQVVVAVRAAGVNRGGLIRGAALRSGAAAAPGPAGGAGVGTAAIQIARAIGANPVLATTRTPGKAAALRALGAHEVINTGDAGWVDAVMKATGDRGVDVIIDHVGGSMLADNIRVMALEARLVSVGRNASRVGDCDLDEIARKRASIIGVTFRTRTPEESLQCSERFATHLLDSFSKG